MNINQKFSSTSKQNKMYARVREADNKNTEKGKN